MKVFLKRNPGPDDNPLGGCSSSLMYYKKALSYFMPNRLMAWNELTSQGNPTKSVLLNGLIKAVKKEVRKQGKPSQADQPMEKSKFEDMLQLLESSGNPDNSQCYIIRGRSIPGSDMEWHQRGE